MSLCAKVNNIFYIAILIFQLHSVENYSKVSMNGRSISSSANNAIFQEPWSYFKKIENNFNLATGEAIDHPSTGV